MSTDDKANPRRDRILGVASRIIGQAGYSAASLRAIAREADVSTGLLRSLFRSKQELLIQAQRATFRQLYRRFEERAMRGDRGLPSALDALDAMWASVRELRVSAPFIARTLAMSGQGDDSARQLEQFYAESTALLEDGIRAVFAGELEQLALPPERMAVIIRLMLEGMVIELARAEAPEDLAQVDQAYADLRELFRRFVLNPEAAQLPSLDSGDAIPLPW
ncbi:MAG: TetR/AcrR family transcriptional regulator [Alphaproteobacteria bacterium]|nr:TetR/AcrR family transcriptional regulator [Alphaproteobacteria bacterium]MCB9794731.1 TetR/AcrR family transcriptional regulator [Alphaproteobacteria bacterium]